MSDSKDKSPDEIEAEIAETREELGDTVADIADKADVKKQASKKADELKEQVMEKKDEAIEKVQAIASAEADPKGGTGGDVGSGPTGDVRNSPEIVGGSNSTLITAAAAFTTGLLLGLILRG